MRADLEYITGVLDELETILQNASKAPMSGGRVIVDRSDVRVLVEELRDSLPKELEEARTVYREHESIIGSGSEEAGRIEENARNRSQEMIEDSETYRRAQRRAEETLDMAERYSEEVSRGSEDYREQVMEQLERWFGESLESVAESRQELEVPSKASEGHDQLDETQPQEPQEPQEPVAGEEGEKGWRASSA